MAPKSKDHQRYGLIKLPNTIWQLIYGNKYLLSLLVSFYMSTRGADVNTAYDIVHNSSKEQIEKLISQLIDYQAGKNIEFDIMVDKTQESDQFKIPDIKVTSQNIKNSFIKKALQSNDGEHNEDPMESEQLHDTYSKDSDNDVEDTCDAEKDFQDLEATLEGTWTSEQQEKLLKAFTDFAENNHLDE